MAVEGANNYMKNGTLMRQVINKINGIDFNVSDDRHLFGDIYEKLLRDLQSAGNAGEFYTPRAVTQFIVDQVNPRRSEEHTSELQSLMRISYAVFCLKNKKDYTQPKHTIH